MNFLRQKWKQKCSAWGPASSVQASIFKNAEHDGIDPASIALAMPMWCPGDQLDYAKLYQHTSSVAFDKNALSFSGSNKISLDASKLGVEVFTIVSCFRTTSTNAQCLYSEGKTSSDLPVRALSILSDGTIQYILRRGDSTAEVNIYSKGPSVRDGKNHIVAATYDDSYDGHLYIDGRYIAFDPGSAFYETWNTFTIGSLVRTSTGSYFAGYYNSLFIFHSVLSSSQISHLSDNPYFLLHRVAPVFYSVPGGAITIKTITDAGSGIDGIAQILNVFALSDTGSGLDGFSGLITGLSVGDVGAGSDSVTPSVRLTLQDTGAAIDLIQKIVSGCNVTDSCVGADNIGQILAALLVADIGGSVDGISVFKEMLKTVTDSVTGTDSLSQILADISICDTGAGADFIDLLTDILKTISDTGSGNDNVSIQPVSISVQDASAAIDIIGYIAVALSVSDASTISAIISTIKTKIVNVTDAGTGADSEHSIAVSVTVSDAAAALDVIGQVINALAVYDTWSGLDRITKTDFNILPSGKVTVTFTIKTPGASFAMRTPKANFNIE